MQFYIAPLQGSLLSNAPSPTSVKQCGSKTREKWTRVGPWRQTQRNRETIPSRRTSHRESAALSDNSPCTGDQQLRLGRGAQWIRRLIVTVEQQSLRIYTGIGLRNTGLRRQ